MALPAGHSFFTRISIAGSTIYVHIAFTFDKYLRIELRVQLDSIYAYIMHLWPFKKISASQIKTRSSWVDS